jgi:hypothetical protein
MTEDFSLAGALTLTLQCGTSGTRPPIPPAVDEDKEDKFAIDRLLDDGGRVLPDDD